jgi:GT2 family glycosyltransferase
MPRPSGRHSRAPEVAVMVLNYNGVRWLNTCVTSVLKSTYPNYRVYLIDNGSTDGSVEFVRRAFPTVQVINFGTNLGFAEAYNRAISQVDCEYAVLLNNDTQVLSQDWLERLVNVADREEAVGAVACKIVSMQDHRKLDSVGGMGIPYWRGFVDIGKDELDEGQYSESFEPFAFCGGAALIRRSAFTDSGQFDERFFLYSEDPDLSWRLRLLGWKVRYASRATVAHYLGGTTGGGDVTPLRLYYCHRNLLRAIIKNCGASLRWALRNYLLFSILITLGFLICEPKKATLVLKGIAWNIRNLRSTYASRLSIQNRREVSEQELLRQTYPLVTRKRPAEHGGLRHTLDILFEFSNRRKFQAAIRNQIS